MAPLNRYTAIPASLWATDSPFLDLSARAQWLYLRLWTSEARNAAGLLPYQPNLLAKSSTNTNAKTISAALEELTAQEWVLVDFDAEQLWLPRFIAEDTFNSPNQYVSAMNAIRTCPSWMLRDAAWKEIHRLGLPLPKSADPDARQRMQARMEKAKAALQARMYANPEGDRKGFERVSKLSNVNANANADAGDANEDYAASLREWHEDEP
jgi:hypothetical protein